MPWDIENLESTEAIFCSVINGYWKNPAGKRLDYKPNKDLLAPPDSRSYRRLIGARGGGGISLWGAKKRMAGGLRMRSMAAGGYAFCSRHGILLTDTAAWRVMICQKTLH